MRATFPRRLACLAREELTRGQCRGIPTNGEDALEPPGHIREPVPVNPHPQPLRDLGRQDTPEGAGAGGGSNRGYPRCLESSGATSFAVWASWSALLVPAVLDEEVRQVVCGGRETGVDCEDSLVGLHCFPDVDLPLPQQSDVHEGRLALRIDLERLLGARQPRVEATGRSVESREAHVSPYQLRLEVDRAVS